MTEDTTTKIAVHEAVCAERYAAIEKSFVDGKLGGGMQYYAEEIAKMIAPKKKKFALV